MKVLVETKDGEGLEALMGQRITLFCVYETGAFSDKAWKDAQTLPNDLYISTAAIEAFGVVK